MCLHSMGCVRNSRPYLSTRVPDAKQEGKLHSHGSASHYIWACDFSGLASLLVLYAWVGYTAGRRISIVPLAPGRFSLNLTGLEVKVDSADAQISGAVLIARNSCQQFSSSLLFCCWLFFF